MRRELNPPSRVLLVDDRSSNLLALRAILEHPDYDLVDAQSGEEALEHFRAEDFAAVLLDVRMPELDGFNTAKDRSINYCPILGVTV